MRRQLRYLPAASILIVCASAVATDGSTSRELELTLDLHDGSHVVGSIPDSGIIEFHTALGDINLSLATVKMMQFEHDPATAKVFFRNGDVLSGHCDDRLPTFQTNLGELSVPTAACRQLVLRSARSGCIVGPFAANTGVYRLLPNGNFERGDEQGWRDQIAERSGVFAASSREAAVGKYSARATPWRDYPAPLGFALRRDIPVQGGQDYVLSGYFHTTSITSGSIYLDVNDTSFDRHVQPRRGVDGWQFVLWTLSIPPGVKQLTVRLCRDDGIKSDEYAYIDEVALTPARDFVDPRVVE